MEKIKVWLSDAWAWVKDKAMKSWTMLGLTAGGVIVAADWAMPFIPDQYKGRPVFFAFLLVLGALRARTL